MPAAANKARRSRTSSTPGSILPDLLIRNALPGELDGLTAPLLRSIADFTFDALELRRPGAPVVKVGNGPNIDGRRTSWIAIVNDDMPFLVDTVTGTIAARNLVIDRLLHPIIDATRQKNGRLKALKTIDPGEAASGLRESLIFIEMERADARARTALATEIEAALADVRVATGDWMAMLDRLDRDAAMAEDERASGFLHWLSANNFTFLGHVRMKADGSGGNERLGILAGNDGPDRLWLDHATPAAIASVLASSGEPLLIAKADRISTIHRRVPLDVVAVPVRNARGKLTHISLYAGLFTSQALSTPPEQVPLIAERLSRLTAELGFSPGSHADKAFVHAVGQIPRDLLFQMDDAALKDIALNAMSLIDRARPKLKTVSDPLGRFTTALVWLPRDEFSSVRRTEIAALLTRSVGGSVQSWSVDMGQDAIASMRFIIRHAPDRPLDTVALDTELRMMIRGWALAVETALRAEVSPTRAARLALSFGHSFSPSYRGQFTGDEAAQDILRLAGLASAESRDVRLYRRAEDPDHHLRLKIYRLDAVIPLSEAVPVLENFGFRVIEEYPFDLKNGRCAWIHDFLVETRSSAEALQPIIPVLEATIRSVLTGEAENDEFNSLIADAALDPFAISMFRVWFRYLRQTGSAYGLSTVVDALRRQPGLARDLVSLFRALNDPAQSGKARTKAADAAGEAVENGLAAVTAIDDDAILRRFRALIRATLRTNVFIPASREAFAFKFDSRAIPWLPAPVPWREIFIYSPRVEGIHLRGGPIARGGIRWSDRRDDFRTEILGLMKAQVVKNAVIVPTGAKGGFYPKQLPSPADRDAWLKEGTESYRIFIRALLSVTDNIIDHKIVHPDGIAIRDDDDPYFVVAADKGTASFSDIANTIATDRGFWLGDAFASGGSHGYDHKAMGITARGAWISVQRHFAELGIDVQKESVTVAGVGDMSGDVFGNGMLLSRVIKLVAAFDHRHIFLDPSPDPAASWKERKRLFDMPRSSWADYDAKLISKGGGVFPRTQKSIPLSAEVKEALGISEDSLDPSALIRAILTAGIDLLWFGGIGTYVKSAGEAHGQVGDRANDANRVDGRNIRARVIGEGANLGVTQAGRIEYAARGGRINTDFIDNSAGVDCSDNEVNIKIALNAEMAAGRLTFANRNALLKRMTDEVAGLVLEDNRLQTLALSLAEHRGAGGLPSYQRVIQTLEGSGRLSRTVEGLPDDEQLASRFRDGRGLVRPELAVLLSYAKLALQDAIEVGDFARDPILEPTLISAFPAKMQVKFEPAIRRHRLASQIVATELANRLINRIGIVTPFALAEEESVSLAHVASAFAAAETLFDLPRLWADIDSAPVNAAAQLALLDAAASAVRLHTADLIRVMADDAAPGEVVLRLGRGLKGMSKAIDTLLRRESRDQAEALRQSLAASGAPAALVERVVNLHALHGAVGIANLSAMLGRSGKELELARAYTRAGEALGLDWANGAAQSLNPSDPWERLLLGGVVRDLEQARLDLIHRVSTAKTSPEKAVEDWLTAHAGRIDQLRAVVTRAKAQPILTSTLLAQIASQARLLVGR